MTSATTDAALLDRHARAVPRYTSYPTAPHFNEDGAEAALDGLLAAVDPVTPVSVYMHVPFCDRLCWFCGCTTKHTLKYGPVEAYVDRLVAHMEQLRERLGFRPHVSHVHLGGGSPSFLSTRDMDRIGHALRDAFIATDDIEISVEIDPNDVREATLEGLAALGMTRASIGVQDFDPDVQAAINRPQSFETTRAVVESLRAHGITSLNIDALYGLPRQSGDRLMRTINQVVSLEPDRVALFGYAHVPWVKKHQNMIADSDLPDMATRFVHADMAAQRLVDACYARIGIDHFAKPGDSLALAATQGRLNRNFQGYTTDPCDVLIGLGASAISSFPGGFLQNHVATGRYQAAVDAGEPTVAKGFVCSGDDRIRAWLIERLMCDFGFDGQTLLARFGDAARPYLSEAQLLAQRDRDGLCAMRDGRFSVSDRGRPFVRIIASWFDAYLDQSTVRYSAAV